MKRSLGYEREEGECAQENLERGKGSGIWCNYNRNYVKKAFSNQDFSVTNYSRHDY